MIVVVIVVVVVAVAVVSSSSSTKLPSRQSRKSKNQALKLFNERKQRADGTVHKQTIYASNGP